MDDRKNTPQLRALVLTEDARDAMWLLRAVPSGAANSGLLGWVMTMPSVDSDAPLPVMEILSRSLCRCAKVTFLHDQLVSDTWAPNWLDVAYGQSTSLRPGRWDRLLRRKPTFPLLCTDSPTVATQLFLTSGFDWPQRGQLALLSDCKAPPPQLPYELFHDLWSGISPPSCAPLSAAGLSGFVSPAVDGDFAQIVAFGGTLWEHLLDALTGECVAAGIEWRRLGEAEFKKTRWLLDPLPEDAS